jgi:hypothetical protein
VPGEAPFQPRVSGPGHWVRNHWIVGGEPIHLVQATLGHASVATTWPVSAKMQLGRKTGLPDRPNEAARGVPDDVGRRIWCVVLHTRADADAKGE